MRRDIAFRVWPAIRAGVVGSVRRQGVLWHAEHMFKSECEDEYRTAQLLLLPDFRNVFGGLEQKDIAR